jgi:hypothetical protein
MDLPEGSRRGVYLVLPVNLLSSFFLDSFSRPALRIQSSFSMGERTPETTIFMVSIHAHISNYKVKNVADVKENGKTKNRDV